MALHDSDKYRLMRNLKADPRLIGSEALLSPLVAHNSSQRMLMFSNNIVQALVINGAEQPNVSSGFERAFQDYTFNTSRLPQDGTTLAVIPKYRANTGPTPIRQTPSYTVIYLGAEDNKVHCIEVPTYVRGIDGFGYETKVDYRYLAPNVGLKKDQCLCRSNAVQGSKYCLGLNVNTAFMTMAETVEDAFCISDELASRMESTAIKTVIIDVDKNDIPLNVYGSEEEYKFFPDIGENIREDGIICALRQAHDSTVVSDMSELALAIPQYSHDNITYAESSGATVIDIDIWWNPSKKVKTPPHIFSQVEKYREGHKFYCARVVETYIKECVKAHREAAPEFISLVDRCESFNAAYVNPRLGMLKKTPPKFTRKSEPIPFLQIVVTYAYKNVVGLGNKAVGRDGSKGTLSAMNIICL